MNLSSSRDVRDIAPQPPGIVPTLRARKQQLVRDTIWKAATDLFAQKGFDETTVDDIALAAGISRRSFFRYFASKSDIMAHGMLLYGVELIQVINACPKNYSLPEVFRRTVLQVARQAASQPRTRKIMEIVAKYPAARTAEVSRLPEVLDLLAKAYTRRCNSKSRDSLAPSILSGLTLQVLAVAFHSWFEDGERDISSVAEQVLATLGRLICDDKQPSRQKGQKRLE